MKLTFMLTLALAAALFTAVVRGADAVPTTLTGMVHVVKAENGDLTAVHLVVDKVTYTIALDDLGKGLAAHDGKTVKVTGTLAGEEGKQTLTVTASEVVKVE